LCSGIGWTTNVIAVFERSQMLLGASNPRAVSFTVPIPKLPDGGLSEVYRWMPSFVDGPSLPPRGTPNFVVALQDDEFNFPADRIQINEVHVDWTNPSASTFNATNSLVPNVPPGFAGFSLNVCQAGKDVSCLPQPAAGAQVLNPLVMGESYRVAYRSFVGHEAMVLADTIAADGDPAPLPPAPVHAGIRWYELRRPSGQQNWSIFQQGTWSPDANNRWLGNIGMDADGNIALGYIAGSASLSPSIRYAGRLATDPSGTLPELERSLAEGLGSQMGTSQYGDYSEMTIDPNDDCTFWLTNTYVPASGPSTGFSDWHTRIGSFRFASCHPPWLAVPATDLLFL
jgi:hypothetical protein